MSGLLGGPADARQPSDDEITIAQKVREHLYGLFSKASYS